MQQWVYQQRQAVEADLPTIAERRYLSPALYAQYAAAVPALQRHLHGVVIDLGCGSAPFWPLVAAQVTRYDGFDRWPRSDKAVLAGDLQNLGMIRSDSYDAALCMEVLEHIPAPWLAVAEIYRILKPGGALVLSVPHLSRLHEIPHDYYRYTRYGLRHLLESSGFALVELTEKGGLFCFLGHQLSTVLLSVAWSLPRLRRLILALNKWLVTLPCYALDQRLRTEQLFPLGYLVVARKPAT